MEGTETVSAPAENTRRVSVDTSAGDIVEDVVVVDGAPKAYQRLYGVTLPAGPAMVPDGVTPSKSMIDAASAPPGTKSAIAMTGQ